MGVWLLLQNSSLRAVQCCEPELLQLLVKDGVSAVALCEVVCQLDETKTAQLVLTLLCVIILIVICSTKFWIFITFTVWHYQC